MTIFKTGLMAGALVMALGGCGGDDNKSGGGACNAFTPCGGNIVGTWDVKDVCVEGKLMLDGCPSATTAFENIRASGTMTFNADMTGSESITLTGGIRVGVPTSCVAGASCSTIDALFKAQFAKDPNGPITAVACTGADPCSCLFTLNPAAMNQGGSYSTANNVLTQGDDKSEYCVAGTELKLQPHLSITDTAGMAMSMDVKANMTLTKK